MICTMTKQNKLQPFYYGLGEIGYDDNEATIPQLKPLNPYGQSKQDFDVWALGQKEKPFFWAGLKFFNVYLMLRSFS